MFRTIIISTIFGVSAIAAATEVGPYAGQEQRAIKALSQQELQDYLEGKGAGLAKAAELNHFPGPAHVLAMAGELQLTPEQRARTQQIFSSMQRDAQRIGKALVEKERDLDRLFASGEITDPVLRSSLEESGRLFAELRRVHLQAHLEQRAVLTAAQIASYDALRGYRNDGGPTPEHSHHH